MITKQAIKKNKETLTTWKAESKMKKKLVHQPISSIYRPPKYFIAFWQSAIVSQ